MDSRIHKQILDKLVGIRPSRNISPKIKLTGATRQDPIEGKAIKEMMNEALYRIKKNHLPKITSFVCHLKVYETGKRTREKKSIHLKLITPAKTFNSDAVNYQLSAALSRAIKTIEKEIRRFKEKSKEKQGTVPGKGRRVMARKRQLEFHRRARRQ